jgi:uncharacterized protein (TIGR00255 family)
MLEVFMVRSMTGFGRGEATGETGVVVVEARSVNHRHLDVALRLPRTLASREADVRRLIQARLERGRVDVAVQVAPLAGESTQRVRLDTALARQYLAAARELGRALDLGGEAALPWVLERPGVTRLEEAETAAEDPWPLLEAALGQALDELGARRAAEGARLAEAVRGLHAELTASVAAMARRAPLAVARREERLRERLAALLGERGVDEARILAEAAIWADKTDVSEELARLAAHLAELAHMLDKGGAIGRPLDFLLQELLREVNTVGSKSDDLELSQAVLAAKGTLEKIREQGQNLE